MQKSFNKYGEENFVFIILEYCNPEDCLKREQYYLDLFKVYNNDFGYNICSVAGNTLGRKHSEEAKIKIANAAKGNKQWLGKKHSEEAKEKISLSKGKSYIFTNPNKQEVVIFNLNKFCRDNNLLVDSMRGIIKGEQKQYRGWTYIHK